MKKELNNKLRITLTVIIGLAAVFLYMYILNVGQNITVTRQVQEEMASDVKSLLGNYENAASRHDTIQASFDDIYEHTVCFIGGAIYDHFFDESDAGLEVYTQVENKDEELQDLLYQFYSFFSLYDIMIVNHDGDVIMSVNSYVTDLKDEKYKPLFDGLDEKTATSLRLLSEEDSCTKYENPDESIKFDLSSFCNYYATSFLGEYILVISVDARKETQIEAQSDAWTVLLQNEIIGEEGYAFVWSDKTNKILYYPEESYKYQDVRELGMDMDKIRDGKYGWNTINKKKMYVYPVYDKERDVWIACAVSRNEMISSRRLVILVQEFVFALFTAALVYYVALLILQSKIQIIPDFTQAGITSNHQRRKYKLFIITVLISTAMLVLSFYLQTLYLMSSWAESSVRQTQKVQSTVVLNEEQANQYKKLFEEVKTTQLSGIAQFLYEHEDFWEQDMLNRYASEMNMSSLQILDKNGKAVVGTTDVEFYADEGEVIQDSTVDYREIVAAQDEGKDVYNWMADGRRVIVPITNYIDPISNYMYVFYKSDAADQALKNFSLSGTLDMARPGIDGFVFTVDKKNHTFTYYPDEEMIGEDALEYGMTEKQIKVNYCDYITIDNVTYYATTDRIGNNIIFFVVAKDKLLRSRLLLSLTAVILAFIMFLVIGIMIYISRDKVEMVTPDSEKRSDRDGSRTPEHKIMGVFKYYIAFGATIIAIYSILPSSANYLNVFGYVLEGNWERGINIFALTSSIIILCRGGILLYIAFRLVGRVAGILPSRSGTILRMLASLLSYIAFAFLLYQCMLSFGLNPTALMASTGIVAVVLGIGANSLVGDILAGIFLLMEGNIQIGDVVQVAGFRGYVMELGIRMTKLYDMDTDDIKFIPNNEVRNFVHMSMRRAVVFSEFQIRYEENLEDVERIIKEELKNVKKKSHFILEGPAYIGVSRLGDSGVCLKTATKCHEAHRKKVEREVNHIVYTIFQKHNIDVPYPQVTVHTGDDSRVERSFDDELNLK